MAILGDCLFNVDVSVLREASETKLEKSGFEVEM